MKKILCIFSALLIVLGAAFFGCGKKNDKAAAEQSETAAPTTESTTAPDPKPGVIGDAALKDGETYTGRAPLPLVDFNVSDPENTRGSFDRKARLRLRHSERRQAERYIRKQSKIL